MKYIKSHKKEFVLLAVAMIILIISGVMFLVIWFQGSNNKYGDRLEGIESVSLQESYITDILNKVKDKDFITSGSYNLEGRLLSITLNVKHDTNKDEVKKQSNIIIENLKEEELKYYDIQLYIVFENEENIEEENKIYPIIGYKHKTSDAFVWSNN